MRLRTCFASCVLFLALAVMPAPSWGIIAVTDDVELEGFVKTQNIIRTPMFRDAEFIMQRNTAQLEGKYYFCVRVKPLVVSPPARWKRPR